MFLILWNSSIICFLFVLNCSFHSDLEISGQNGGGPHPNSLSPCPHQCVVFSWERGDEKGHDRFDPTWPNSGRFKRVCMSNCWVHLTPRNWLVCESISISFPFVSESKKLDFYLKTLFFCFCRRSLQRRIIKRRWGREKCRFYSHECLDGGESEGRLWADCDHCCVKQRYSAGPTNRSGTSKCIY